MENLSCTLPFPPYIKFEMVKIEVKTEQHEPEELNQMIKTEIDVKLEAYKEEENDTVKKEDIKIEYNEHESWELHVNELDESQDVEKTTENKILSPTSSQNTWKCSLCNFDCNDKNNLGEHITFTHKDPSNLNLFKCDICHRTTRYLHELAFHKAYHKADVDVPSNQSIVPVAAVKQETNSEGEEQKCGLCNLKFKNVGEHVASVHKNSSNMFKCNMCDYVTEYFHLLAAHIPHHDDHSDTKWYRCYKCSYRSRHKHVLRKHILKHYSLLEDAYTCDTCPFKSASFDSLKKHLWVHKDEPYKCEACDYTTKYKNQLKVHMLKHIESQGMHYRCDVCQFRIKNMHKLLAHAAGHAKRYRILD